MIYLDNAATSYYKPPEVIDAVCRALKGMGNAGRGTGDASVGAARILFETRQKLSDLFHADGPKQVSFTSNSTEALNTALNGLLNPGDHVITTMMEHNSVLRPLYRLEAAGVAETIIKADRKGLIDYDDFERSIRPETKAIVCTHGSNLTGNLVDIARVGKTAAAHGLLFIVDASQTAGVFPIDMQTMHIDVLCFTGHKSLLGPQGTGGLAVRTGVEIRPLKVGGSGIHTFDHEHPSAMPESLEAGTVNGHGIAGLSASLSYLEKVGIDFIRHKEQTLMTRFYNGIADVPGVTVYGDFHSMDRVPIVTINIRDYTSGAVSDALLADYKIQTRAGGHCAPLMHEALGTTECGAVRFSFSHFNTEAEIDTAIKAVREIAAE